MMAGKIPAFFLPVPGKSKRMSPQAPLYPAMRGMALWVFSYVASASCAFPGSDHHRDIRNSREQNNHASPGGHETGSATTAEGHTATAVENGKGDHPERRTGPLDIIRKMPARHMDTALGNTCQLQHRCPSGFHRQFPPGAGAALCTLYPG